jgi:quercetin dioxygenase-like cupin family protein
MDLTQFAQFSLDGPVKTDIMKINGSNIVVVCLEDGQSISPHQEPYAVAFVVLQGEGVITSGAIDHPVGPYHLIPVGKGEIRGIRCIKRMMLLGIREDV